MESTSKHNVNTTITYAEDLEPSMQQKAIEAGMISPPPFTLEDSSLGRSAVGTELLAETARPWPTNTPK